MITDSGRWVPISMENVVKPAFPYGAIIDLNNSIIRIENYTIYTHVKVKRHKYGRETIITFLSKPGFKKAYKFPVRVMHITNGEMYMETTVPPLNKTCDIPRATPDAFWH